MTDGNPYGFGTALLTLALLAFAAAGLALNDRLFAGFALALAVSLAVGYGAVARWGGGG